MTEQNHRCDVAPREYRMSCNLRMVITGLALSVLVLVWGIVSNAPTDGDELAPTVVLIRNGITAALALWVAFLWALHGYRRYYVTPESLTMRGLFGRPILPLLKPLHDCPDKLQSRLVADEDKRVALLIDPYAPTSPNRP